VQGRGDSGRGLGLTNLAVVSAYVVPPGGKRRCACSSPPYNGFADRAHSVATIFARNLFDLESAHPIVCRRRPGAHGARHDLGERSDWEGNAATAAMLREQAMELHQQAHQARSDAMYLWELPKTGNRASTSTGS
jgi:hypothetical protein